MLKKWHKRIEIHLFLHVIVCLKQWLQLLPHQALPVLKVLHQQDEQYETFMMAH